MDHSSRKKKRWRVLAVCATIGIAQLSERDMPRDKSELDGVPAKSAESGEPQ
jgi:hypothetical protein